MPSSKEIADLIDNDEIEFIQTYKSKYLTRFYDDDYKNILLFTARNGSVGMMRTIYDILGRDKFDELIGDDDNLNRTALMLAAISDNIEMLSYLKNECHFKINYRKNDLSALTYSIKRNSRTAFNYLLMEGSYFKEPDMIAISQNESFKNYFNSPECFFIVIQSGNKAAFDFLLRHIKGSSQTEREEFFTKKDRKGKTALHYLSENLNKLNLTKKEQIAISDLFLVSYGNTTFEGYHINKKIKDRPYRSFEGERERQLLRHIGTQLFFYLSKKINADLVEVQVMHLNINEKHSIFIAVNQAKISEDLDKYITEKNFNNILTKNHNPSGNEAKIRSERYAEKLENRIFGANIQVKGTGVDGQNAEAVATLLRDKKIKTLLIGRNSKDNKNAMKNSFEESVIYLISAVNSVNTSTVRRHSEEFLTDIADYANEYYDDEDDEVYTCIAGKKRPCIGCFGRMTGSIDKFGNYPGLFWKNTMQNQESSPAKQTFNALLSESSHITLCRDGKTRATDFDSGSDTEISEEESASSSIRSTIY